MEAVARAKAGMDEMPPIPLPPPPSLDISSLMNDNMDISTSISTSGGNTIQTFVDNPPTLPRTPPSWRPGLFQVVVGGKVSDVLGLADVVFPAMLAGW
eukprot:CAMPEP_0119054392 /NCGR_PEP_ID=MMETSP1177-20130426/75032_1 /TAXON_ID=2985 /ORGANISM="Ochromonas sp, Strain CCMP1899" /LENGTH=97 /DNA_ID=CAMNT_0007034605 /DNA_START=1250 /DNA_END=1540 /DNA_ORIENTATION=-